MSKYKLNNTLYINTDNIENLQIVNNKYIIKMRSGQSFNVTKDQFDELKKLDDLITEALESDY